MANPNVPDPAVMERIIHFTAARLAPAGRWVAMDADDLAQEARLAQWRKPGTRAGLAMIDALRRASHTRPDRPRQHPFQRVAYPARHDPPAPPVYDPSDDDPGLPGLLRGLDRLTVAQRRVVVGRYWEQATSEALAAELGLSASRVRDIHAAALSRLRRLFAA